MTIDELKSTIEQRTGIRSDLLQGKTPEEVISYARNLAEFAKPVAPASPIGADGQEKSPREIFGDWAQQTSFFGRNSDPDEGRSALHALDQIEASLSYPDIQDGGETQSTYTPKPKDQFVEWARSALAYNPYNL